MEGEDQLSGGRSLRVVAVRGFLGVGVRLAWTMAHLAAGDRVGVRWRKRRVLGSFRTPETRLCGKTGSGPPRRKLRLPEASWARSQLRTARLPLAASARRLITKEQQWHRARRVALRVLIRCSLKAREMPIQPIAYKPFRNSAVPRGSTRPPGILLGDLTQATVKECVN